MASSHGGNSQSFNHSVGSSGTGVIDEKRNKKRQRKQDKTRKMPSTLTYSNEAPQQLMHSNSMPLRVSNEIELEQLRQELSETKRQLTEKQNEVDKSTQLFTVFDK